MPQDIFTETKTVPNLPSRYSGINLGRIKEMTIQERLEMMELITNSTVERIQDNLDMGVISDKVSDLLNLFGLSRLDMKGLTKLQAEKLEKILDALIATGFCEMNSPFDYNFTFGSQSGYVNVPAVGMLNKNSLKVYFEKILENFSSVNLSTSFTLGLDIASFGDLSFDFLYGDGKKQEISLRMLELIKNNKYQIIEQVLKDKKYDQFRSIPGHPKREFLPKYFDIRMFNIGGDEFGLIGVCKGEISDKSRNFVALATEEIANKMCSYLIQNLAEIPITSFTSSIPLTEGVLLGEKPLEIRREDEFANCPNTIEKLKNSEKFPKIAIFLNNRSIEFEEGFLRELRGYWSKTTIINGLVSKKDLDTNYLNYVDKNFDTEGNLFVKKVVEKKVEKMGENNLKENIKREKYQRSPFFAHILRQIHQYADSITSLESKKKLLDRFYTILKSFELANFPKGFDEFANINSSVLKILYQSVQDLIPKAKNSTKNSDFSSFFEKIYYAKLLVRPHNNATNHENGGHSKVDGVLRDVMAQLLIPFDQKNVERLLEFYKNETYENENIDNEKSPKNKIIKLIIKKESANLDIILGLIRDSVIATMFGPCPAVLTHKGYIAQLDQMVKIGKITQHQKIRFMVLCSFLLEEIGSSLGKIDKVEVQISENGNKTSNLPITVVQDDCGESLAETAQKCDGLGKKSLNLKYLGGMMVLNSNEFGQEMSKLYRLLTDFENTGKYELQGNTEADSRLGTWCDPKRGIGECTNLLVNLIELIELNPQITKNSNLLEIVKMVNTICQRLLQKKELEISKLENESEKSQLYQLNQRMNASFVANIEKINTYYNQSDQEAKKYYNLAPATPDKILVHN